VECGSKGVVHRFGTHIRPRCDEVGSHSERGAGLGSALYCDAGLVDMEYIFQGSKALPQEGLEGGGYWVGALFETEFHNAENVSKE
jgi:hypothetical protein